MVNWKKIGFDGLETREKNLLDRPFGREKVYNILDHKLNRAIFKLGYLL